MEPAKLTCMSVRAKMINCEDNEVKMASESNLLDERRETASRRVETYQRRITRYYNNNVKPGKLTKGDLVLRKVTSNTKKTR